MADRRYRSGPLVEILELIAEKDASRHCGNLDSFSPDGQDMAVIREKEAASVEDRIEVSDLRSLSLDESRAIHLYSLHEYGWINRKLRDGTKLNDTEMSFINTLITGITKLERHKGICYRGNKIGPGQYSLYQNAIETGKAIAEPAFLSASMDLNIAYNFLDDVIYEIISANGRIITRLGIFPDEQEVIFLPGTEFLVREISAVNLNDKINFTKIFMEEK